MNCEQSRAQLDASFDEGLALQDDLRKHLDTCPSCTAYQAELESLDGLLCHTAPVEEDPALVARIQAAVARPRTPSVPVWLGMAAALAVVVASFAGGWAMEHYVAVPDMNALAWLPNEPILPDWTTLRGELRGIPMQVHLEATTLTVGVQEFWNRTAGILTSWLGGNSLLLWGGCIAGLALVVLVDGREVRRIS